MQDACAVKSDRITEDKALGSFECSTWLMKTSYSYEVCWPAKWRNRLQFNVFKGQEMQSIGQNLHNQHAFMWTQTAIGSDLSDALCSVGKYFISRGCYGSWPRSWGEKQCTLYTYVCEFRPNLMGNPPSSSLVMLVHETITIQSRIHKSSVLWSNYALKNECLFQADIFSLNRLELF